MEELLKTPLYEKHKALNAQNVGFCGWDMPIQYDGIIAEHGYCRNDVALFDTSHMGEFFFKGDIQKSAISAAVSIDIDVLPIGKCKYGFLLNEQGGVIDDLIVYKLSANELKHDPKVVFISVVAVARYCSFVFVVFLLLFWCWCW